MVKVSVVDGNKRISRDLPVVPDVGEDVRLVVPGTPNRDLKVRSRRWIFPVGQEPEVELDCS